MSNIRAVAKKAGVSIATVSRAFTNPEKVSKPSLKKVMDAVEAVGYRPNMMARNFRSAKAYAVVVLVPDFANLFFTKVIRAIQETAIKNGYNILLGETRDSMEREAEYIKLVETRQADGVIQLSPHTPDRDLLPHPHIHAVAACGATGTPYTSVRMDHVAASFAIVNYLVSMGHKRIGCITGLEKNPHSIDRLEGYKTALAQAGIEFDPELLFEGDFTMSSGHAGGDYFAQFDNIPSAIFCMNDEMAAGAIKALRENNLNVPQDVSIVGFDDLAFATYTDPAITTIRQPAEEMGKKAMQLLLQLMDGKELNQQEYILKHEFVLRESVQPYKG
ncbi:LacI family transcriptional regulator [Catenovulum sp. 2E275]|uniref:LacI family DNA-binding transcriptional regulator n=1 Tax=Catenovulum sp. 2E275 TaxID=2980497 RepID=UPI0021D2B6D5|nr:LacI family DNA-binding transcriptional regulator [Catenovulum sp. 2E275]MCU4675957.1 LacI family transcriptional regulator [Catenovulum sp. 2E275]